MILGRLCSEIINFTFPLYCLNCLALGDSLCDICSAELAPVELRCIICSRKNPLGLICHSCRGKYEPDLAVACYKFESKLQGLIHEFKYNDCSCLYRFFADRITRLIKKTINYSGYEVVAIPLSSSKERFRGYNQARLISKCVAQNLKIGLTDVLIRVEANNSQAKAASRKERYRNIKGAFSLTGTPGKKIILIDDVITTGATIREATRTLKKAGAREVMVFAIAM